MSIADYSSGPISPTRLRSAGITGVVRYVTGGSASKHITAAEYRDLLAGQIAVALVYEVSEQTLIASGWDARTAAEAIRNDCAALGYEGAVYIAADWDMTAAQWPTARSRLGTIASVLGLARTGLYGSYDAITWSVRDGAATWFWQSMSRAFSAGRNAVAHPRAHLHQRSTSTVDGYAVDLSDMLQSRWGQVLPSGQSTVDEIADLMTGRNFAALAWRVAALQHGAATVQGGPHEGEQMWLVQTLDKLTADVAELKARPAATITLTDADRTAIAAAIAAALPPGANAEQIQTAIHTELGKLQLGVVA